MAAGQDLGQGNETVPKIVDHKLQRQKFAAAAMSLIARHGLEGVTMRAVAKEAGLSYGSLFHYFESKDELLKHAIQYSTSLQTQRLNEFSNKFSGLKALEHLLCDDAIINDSSRDSWMVWMTFQYKVALQSSFIRLHAELAEGWLTRITTLLYDAQNAGEINSALDVDLEAMAVWAYSAGIGQLGLLHPKSLPAKMQKQLITAYLERLRSTA